MQKKITQVLMVCLGNICRSPTAHGVFEAVIARHGLAQRVSVDSCGTSHWHIGEQPDSRATAAAAQRGYDLRGYRARQIAAADFAQFDYIMAMDNANLADLQAICPASFAGHLGLFLDFAVGMSETEVPDPYYGGQDGFAHVLDLVESASEGLVQAIKQREKL